jgi:hypothetical protein
MTHAIDQRAAQARDDATLAAELAADMLGEPEPFDRASALGAVAVGLLLRAGGDVNRLAWAAAELALLLREARPVELVLPPAAADIRLAADFPRFGG